MTEYITWVIENKATLSQLIASTIGLFALVATLTPNESDNKWADRLLKLINTLGANFGKAENK